MRHTLATLAIIALLLFAGCGGGKKQVPQYEPETTPEETMTGDTGRTQPEMEEEDLTRDSGVDFSDEAVGERPISDMTLEEINAAEFLKNIHFDFDKYDLTDIAISQLEQNGRWLQEHPTVKVIIEGHCDERGTEEYNLALGERRANAARDFLLRMGIDRDRLMTASYGESRPLDRGSNEAAWALNRRAHFRVYSR